MKIYLIRHAQSLSRDGLNYTDGSKVGISEIGVNRAHIASEFIKNTIKPDVIYSSPFQRTKETADIIAKKVNLNVVFDDRVVEYAPSKSLTGTAFKEAKRRARLNKDLSPADGESFNAASRRFIGFLNEIVKSGHQRPLVVTHALVMQCALVNLFGLKDYPHLDEVSITELEFDGTNFHLNYMNDTSFIPFSFFRKIKARIKSVLNREDSYS